ncbi:polysaccharide biosynthesis/export family protein [bacterium]|nr:polysaccharide biosynthesis/export family protein [bacterium]
MGESDDSKAKQGVSLAVSDSNEEEDDDFAMIGPGDRLVIQVYNEKELSGSYQVSPGGLIMFPFIGEINVNGLNNFTLAAKISDLLRDGYIKNPSVTVLVDDVISKRIFVLGQVKNSGSFPIKARMSVVEAITLSGGFTQTADLNNVVVTRKEADGREKRYVINIQSIVNGSKENFYLRAGDIIFVGERFF